MVFMVLSIVGVAALGGGVAAGLWALVNAIRRLGELLEELETAGPTPAHRHAKDGGRAAGR
jgi:hypothetical protein